MMRHGGAAGKQLLTEADMANSATQFLVDMQLKPFDPRLCNFLPTIDPNSYVLQTDDEIKKVTKQATAKKLKKQKTFSGLNYRNSTSQSSLTSAKTEKVVFVSKDAQETTSAVIIAMSQDPQEVQTLRPCGNSSRQSRVQAKNRKRETRPHNFRNMKEITTCAYGKAAQQWSSNHLSMGSASMLYATKWLHLQEGP